MKYLFGPVNSRRLGLSQGVDLLPPKICNFNCIYCEVGPTTRLTCERREYVPTGEVVDEIDRLTADADALEHLDVFTITASGEPTLHSGIGEIIRHIKNRAEKPVAVLTNGSLLHLPEVRRDLLPADIVIPSLDAAREESYRKINRPAACTPLAQIIAGLKQFSKEFQGRFWLEILLASGINDRPEDIDALREAVLAISPERIQLNTVARPPLESFAQPLTQPELESVAARLGAPVEILVDFATRNREKFRPAAPEDIVHMLQRRPCTADDICEALRLDPGEITNTLATLEHSGLVHKTRHYGREYYQAKKQ